MAEIIRATWDDLRSVVQAANTELMICTPYFSSEGIEQLFDVLNGAISFLFITRLSPSDWLHGISSPDELLALLQVLDDAGYAPSLIVHQRLHAKAYIADQNCGLIGSANLTAGGFESNFEIMVRLLPGEARRAYEMIRNEISANGKELAILQLRDWINRFKEQLEHSRPTEDLEAQTLAEMQRELDKILGYGNRESIQPTSTHPVLETLVEWLGNHRELPGAEVLLDRHYNISGHNLTGHFRQSFYGVYRFLYEYPKYVEILSRALSELEPDDIYQPDDEILDRWTTFLDGHATEHGEGYDFAILRGILPPRFGGTRLGGGGGSSTLKRMLPLVARFVEESGDKQ